MLNPGSKRPYCGQVPPKTLVFGCGYLGSRVVNRALAEGHEVWATTRNMAKAQSLRRLGVEPIQADWTDRRTLEDLPDMDQLLVSVSFDPRGQSSRWEAQVGGLRNLIERIPKHTSICYISTTGVYHQTGGQWVDESSPTNPSRIGARVHLVAENLLHRFRPESAWTILRLSGIYGPGRIPRLADLRAGRPVASPSHGYLNLIHVDDAANAVLASWTRAKERVYLVSDDQPVVRRDFYRHVAKELGAADPTFVDPGHDASARMRSESNKRIWNRRMKRDLVPRLLFPSFREGLSRLI